MRAVCEPRKKLLPGIARGLFGNRGGRARDERRSSGNAHPHTDSTANANTNSAPYSNANTDANSQPYPNRNTNSAPDSNSYCNGNRHGDCYRHCHRYVYSNPDTATHFEPYCNAAAIADSNAYTIDPATGMVLTTVGPLHDALGHLYGLTGLKYDSIAGIVYAATSGQSPTNPSWLAILDPATALVTPIGPFGDQALTDLAIDPTTGIMYGISGFDQKFYTINTSTGQAVQSGSTGIGFANGGGFASDLTGALFGFSNLSFYSFNKTTGAATLIGGTDLGNLVKAADVSPSNVFYALEGGGGVDNTHFRWLDTCNVTTGACTRVGQINANDLDALGFIPQ